MIKGLINIIGPTKRRRLLVVIAIALSIGMASSAAFCLDLLHSTQLRSSDLLFQAASATRSQESGDKIVIVSIDDRSLDKLGLFSSWSRSYYADLIDALAQAQSRVIVFDVLFSEPGIDDERLAASVKNAGNVVLPVVQTPAVANSTMAHTASRSEFLRPLAVLEESAAAVGHANVFPDKDGVVRRLPVAITNGEDYEAALALAAVAKYLRRPVVLESPAENGVLPFAGRSIPVGEDTGMLINYAGNSVGTAMLFPVVSFVDVLTGQLDYDLFQDKIVIVGATASGLGDKYWTPLGQIMSGVEIHANAIDMVLTGDFLTLAPSALTIMSILILALICGLVAWRFRPLWAAMSAVLLCIVYLLAVSACFDKGLVLDMLYPPLSIAGTFVAVNLYNVASERSQRRDITKTFGRYVSGSVAAKILEALEQGELKLGGQEQEVTVAFADVRGFTSLSEALRPEELVTTLNTYLSTIVEVLLKYDATINKFGGDSIMAIWNVPAPCENHPLMAVKAAKEVQDSIEEIHGKNQGLPKIGFGIGINTGMAVAGNMGSKDRLEYTVIGDTVNLAARLTGVTPAGKLWIGSKTFELVKGHIKAKPLHALEVKGKREPIEAYEVMDVISDSK